MEKADWVQKILTLLPAERVKKMRMGNVKSVSKKTPQYYVRKQRRMKTPTQLIQICNENEIYTMQQMIQYNKTHTDKISLATVKYWFGNWRAFKRRLNKKPSKHNRYVQSQVIDLCVRFNVKTLNDFQKCHQQQPTIFPSSDWVQRHFGKWKYFKRILQACSVQKTLQKYVDLKIKLRRYPSRIQCKKNQIQIELLLSVWQPSELRQTVQMLERIYKNAKR